MSLVVPKASIFLNCSTIPCIITASSLLLFGRLFGCGHLFGLGVIYLWRGRDLDCREDKLRLQCNLPPILQGLLDGQQSVEFGDAFTATRGSELEEACAHPYCLHAQNFFLC
ncbi:hypothetical protein DPMN_107408 [Dreissena polymorpha]|uniref:Uncharacterized protein n=1 Tax=Dreissena polymorpha TaxID=45954 RepID=A0A9D4QKX3_DREPO|nr:hypothetical protein DPMN_107408 [Dreissena polymorpha]